MRCPTSLHTQRGRATALAASERGSCRHDVYVGCYATCWGNSSRRRQHRLPFQFSSIYTHYTYPTEQLENTGKTACRGGCRDRRPCMAAAALPGRVAPVPSMRGPITPRAPENQLGAYQGPSSHRTRDPLAENRRPGMSALPRHQSGCEAVPAGYSPGTGHSRGTEPSVVRVHHRYRARPRPPLQDRLITGGGGKKITRTVT